MNSSTSRSLLIAVLCLALAGPAEARSSGQPEAGSAARFIVVLEKPPLAEWFARGGGAATTLQAAQPGKHTGFSGAGRLNTRDVRARAYVDELDEDFARFRGGLQAALGRNPEVVQRYRNALNGFTAHLSEDEARRLAALPGVKWVERDSIQKLQTDAGPKWIGADDVWNGLGGLPKAAGEGIIVGVIDSGINWEHDSFKDLGDNSVVPGGPYNHKNPLGEEVGLCSQPLVLCNDKLIGVYDFVTDNPDSETVEESTDGFDNDGHGSHVASTAVGNSRSVSVLGKVAQISGVAPNANLISYRVCFIGDPEDPDDDGCQTSAILEAIDQAIEDGVDVINYSIGTDAFSPWFSSSTPQAFLNAYGAGIFVATSAGNTGPLAATIGSPANAPWISAVGNATHNRIFGNQILDLSGGDTAPPGPLTGASLSGDSGVRAIVHAKDYGNALCGVGDPELQAGCDSNTGASNPFPPGTFNGEIVVCDRGIYGRVEKGKNLLLAGAGGYILANVDEQGSSIVADSHCLPASHITDTDGDALRAWLNSGAGHSGSIGPASRRLFDSQGDRISSSSSRGPALAPVEQVLKPNLIAPGTDILAAFAKEGANANQYAFLTGTSMASPHVAGAAALLRSAHPGWSPSMLNSALETTAFAGQAIDSDDTPASPFEAGLGRPVLGDAVNAGLYLDETQAGFSAANPAVGGDPKDLNLPGLLDSGCRETCSFSRTVTSMTSSKTWSAAAVGFPAGVNVTVSPSQFTLANGASQALSVEVDLLGSGLTGQWVYGAVRLSADGEPDQHLAVAVFASGGDLPAEWYITTDRDSGWKDFLLANLSALPDATYTGALAVPQRDTAKLREDLADNPFVGGSGKFTVLRQVPEGTLWLHAETLASNALDLDLYVGRDDNGNGLADEDETVCESLSPEDLEFCDLFEPTPGTYWIVVQRWCADGAPNSPCGSSPTLADATLLSAVVGGNDAAELSASGQGITATGEAFPVRVSWNNVNALPGDELLGAVGIGTDRQHPNNVGIIPVRFKRSAIAPHSTFPLMAGHTQRLALRKQYTHRRIYIDVPAGAQSLTVAASGATTAQSDALSLELKRMDFDAAFGNAPFALVSPAGAPVASASGGGGQGPAVTVSGATLVPGRWYAELTNGGGEAAAVEIQADVAFSGEPVPVFGGLWQPASRPGVNQGYEFSAGGRARALIWYAYDENHGPVWYLATGLAADGNIWVADLWRYTNDGASQQAVRIGRVAITALGFKDAIFSFILFGEAGSDRMAPISVNTCPQIGGQALSVIGLWFPGIDGLGGASVLYNDFAHFEIHYLYDQQGNARWLGAGTPVDDTLSLLQFTGDCPVCAATATGFDVVGTMTHDFQTVGSGSWTLDYVLNPPLMGDVQRTDNIVKLTDVLECQ